jgi:hypothetical protein
MESGLAWKCVPFKSDKNRQGTTVISWVCNSYTRSFFEIFQGFAVNFFRDWRISAAYRAALLLHAKPKVEFVTPSQIIGTKVVLSLFSRNNSRRFCRDDPLA